MKLLRIGTSLALTLIVGAGGAIEAAGSDIRVYPVAEFDLEENESPEGLAIDRRGAIYTGMAQTGEIRRIDPRRGQSTVATLDVGEGFLLGLTMARDGSILAALTSSVPATHGVWRVTADGDAQRVAALDPSGQPNGITTDRRGNIYVGDSLLGLVWRITPSGAVERWAEHPLLEGDPDGGIPGVSFGANGVVVRHGQVYVANTEGASVVRIPIRRDGSAGTPRTYIEHPELLGADGLAFDVRGNLYVTTDGLGNSLVRVTPQGTVKTLVTADDGLDFVAGVKFGRGRLPHDTVFTANGGLNFGRPAVQAVDVGVPGLPR